MDHARIGLLMLRRGVWRGRRLLSEAWIDACVAPSPLNPSYGYLWWLNATGEVAPAASKSSFFAIGVGANMIWVDPEDDLVVVLRWIERDRFAEFAEILKGAVRSG